jgi:hypothetical protein
MSYAKASTHGAPCVFFFLTLHVQMSISVGRVTSTFQVDSSVHLHVLLLLLLVVTFAALLSDILKYNTERVPQNFYFA